MKKMIFISAIIGLIMVSCSNQIVCDKFDVSYELHDSSLTISLDTDLPEDTELMVSVDRSYTEVGNDTIYSMHYFKEKMTVKSFSQAIKVDIRDEIWFANSQKHQEEMKAVDLGYEVDKIDDNISISIVVPINQSNSAFGEKNINLVGNKVKGKSMKIVEDEKVINLPMK